MHYYWTHHIAHVLCILLCMQKRAIFLWEIRITILEWIYCCIYLHKQNVTADVQNATQFKKITKTESSQASSQHALIVYCQAMLWSHRLHRVKVRSSLWCVFWWKNLLCTSSIIDFSVTIATWWLFVWRTSSLSRPWITWCAGWACNVSITRVLLTVETACNEMETSTVNTGTLWIFVKKTMHCGYQWPAHATTIMAFKQMIPFTAQTELQISSLSCYLHSLSDLNVQAFIHLIHKCFHLSKSPISLILK